MEAKKLLDCTLRDGGYVNDWEFGHSNITSVFERLVSSGVDIIEIGFLDARRNFDTNRTIMPDTYSAQKIFGEVDKGNAMIVGMIDYGTCPIENIQNASESYLDGIRVIFKEEKMYEAIEFCKKIKALGYKVFAQAVSITSYTDDKLLELVRLVNILDPYALSIVDTYGLLHQGDLLHIFEIMDKNLNPEISIGYHSHNNFQLAYANSIEILNKPTNRNILVDATLYGMGKSAGNCPIELISMYMNENFGKNYDNSQMMEAIETNILDIYNKNPWGYKLFYYIAASNKCHPNYVSFLMNKATLSIKSINEILKMIDFNKKLLYDQKHIEELYLKYQKNECNDLVALRNLENELQGRKVLILGPGKSIIYEREKVEGFINNCDAVVMSINYIPDDLKPDYLFLTNSKRYAGINTKSVKNTKIIATSNVTGCGKKFSYKVNYSSLIDPETEIPDNSLIMLLKLLKSIGVSEIFLAGFDGYDPREMNYFKTNMEYDFVKEKANYLNEYVNNYLANVQGIDINFITNTIYKKNSFTMK